jgi:serine/threonine protein kinase
VGTSHISDLRRLFEQAVTLPPTERLHFVGSSAVPQELRHELLLMLQAFERSYSLLDRDRENPTSAERSAVVVARAQVGAYRILRELGRGGMGIVYLAVREDEAFQKTVALKVMRPDGLSHDSETRFRQERQILAAVDHPAIARILDGGTTEDGAPYYVMEYVDGLPLDTYCEERQLSLPDRLSLVMQVCRAVQYLHDHQIIHRDLKPGNILVSGDGAVKLLDFGIAKVHQIGNPGHTMQMPGGVFPMMTPAYASPEQLAGQTVTRASDLYSLGVILYLVLTGQHPYGPALADPGRLPGILRHLKVTKPSANIRPDLKVREGTAQLRRRVIGDLDKIVLRTLQPLPADRYPTAAELEDDLQRFLTGQPVRAQEPTVVYRTYKFLGRNRFPVAAALLIAVLSGFGTWQTVAARLEQQQFAAKEQEMERLVDSLIARLQNWERPTSPAGAPGLIRPQEQAVDVARLSAALKNTFGRAIEADSDAGNFRKPLISKVDQYLRKATQVATAPDVRYELAMAWRYLGDVQGGPSKPNLKDRTAAIASYTQAAALLNAVALVREDTGEIRRRLAEVNARLLTLGERPTPPGGRGNERPAMGVAPVRAEVPSAIPVGRSRINSSGNPFPQVSQGKAAVQATDRVSPTEASTVDVPDDLQTRYDSAVAETATAKEAVEDLKATLAARGLTLNTILSATLVRMQSAIEEARAAMQRGDSRTASDAITRAQAEAARVMRTFGR